MGRRGRIVAVTAAALLVILGAGLYLAADYFFGLAVRRADKDFLDASPDLRVGKGPEPSRAFSSEWFLAQRPEEVTITSADGLSLHAWYLAPLGGGRVGSGAPKAAILAHGYSATALSMGGFARFYAESLGYAVLLPDARGHGKSGGSYIGFGWPERKDLLAWAAWLEGRLPGARIALHGVSMGAATVMMAAGEDLPQAVKAVVEDCGYTSVEEELAYQLKRLYGLPAWPLLPLASGLTKLRAGYSFREASALAQVRKATVPLLFIHGEADTFVPFEMEFRLYEAAPEPKEILVVPEAGHGLAYDTDPEAYEARVRLFLEKYLGK